MIGWKLGKKVGEKPLYLLKSGFPGGMTIVWSALRLDLIFPMEKISVKTSKGDGVFEQAVTKRVTKSKNFSENELESNGVKSKELDINEVNNGIS